MVSTVKNALGLDAVRAKEREHTLGARDAGREADAFRERVPSDELATNVRTA